MKNLKTITFVIGLLICMLCIGSVSAESFEEEYDESVNSNTHSSEYISGSANAVNGIYYADYAQPSLYQGLFFITYDGGPVYITGCDENVNYRFRSYNGATENLVIEGTMSYDNDYNWLGERTDGYIWVHVDQMHYGNISGNVYSQWEIVASNGSVLASSMTIGRCQGATWSNTDIGRIYFTGSSMDFDYGMSLYYENDWESSVSGVYGADETFSSISLIRNGYLSNFTVYDLDGNIIRSDYSTRDLDGYIFDETSYSYLLENQFGTEFSKILQIDEPEADTVSILTHVYSTADKSLIGGATANYTATDGSDTQEQILSTGEGIFSVTRNLEYTITASAEGYIPQSSVADTAIFTADSQFAVYLTPVGNVSAGNGAINFQVFSYTETGSVFPLQDAIIEIDNQTLITNSAGYERYEVSKNDTISYRAYKDGYVTYSRTFTPTHWTNDVIDEYIYLRPEGLTLPGEPTPVPTTDIRTDNQKAESAFAIIFEHIETIATLAVFVVILSLLEMVTGGGKRRWR